MARAIREEWPISAEERKRVMARLLSVVDGKHDGRAARAAATLIAADNVNAKREASDVAADNGQLSASAAAVQAALQANPALLDALLAGPPPVLDGPQIAQDQPGSTISPPDSIGPPDSANGVHKRS